MKLSKILDNELLDAHTQNLFISKQVIHAFTGYKARSWEILILDTVSIESRVRDRVASITIDIDLCH